MALHNDIAELLKAGVINTETAVKIQEYYGKNRPSSTNRLFVVFGILGAILVGLGIILIVAHNWDELSRGTKATLAFLPMIIGQLCCVFTLLKRQDSVAWREGSAAFLCFAVGACIALISQIYNIPGDIGAFLLTWVILCVPLIYVMRSSITSLLCLIGITFYACILSYWSYPMEDSHLYWLVLIVILPHYYLLLKNIPKSNFTTFHNWLVPLSVVITLGTLADDHTPLMWIAYVSLFGILYQIGNIEYFNQQKLRNNGFKIIGSLGTIGLLLYLSFNFFWEDLIQSEFGFSELIASREFWVATILSLLAAIGLGWHFKNNQLILFKPIALVFFLFILTFIIGIYSPIAIVLINLLLFAIGVLTVRVGADQDHLGILNYGLLIITALVICRFFDSDISFVFRGILFMLVGIGFFTANYLMLKKRKTHE
jgi:uncharacterized membrane protein